MQAKLFDWIGDNKVIKKSIGGLLLNSQNYSSLVAAATFETIEVFKPLSDLTGTILLTYSDIAYRCNYVMLNFGTSEVPYTKNYFITDRQVIEGGLMRLYLKCDVLTTYMIGVLATTVCCKRTYVSQTPYINDSLAPIEQRKVIAYQEPVSGNDNLCAHGGNFILITVG